MLVYSLVFFEISSPAFFGLHPKGESLADKTAFYGASPPTIFIVTYFISVSIPGLPPAAGFFAFDIFQDTNKIKLF